MFIFLYMFQYYFKMQCNLKFQHFFFLLFYFPFDFLSDLKINTISGDVTSIIKNITKTCIFKYTENFTTRKWKFSVKNPNIIHISALNIDCGYSLEPPRRGCSNEYPQSMFSSKNKKNNVYPCKPQFYYIKMGFKGVKII